MENTIKIAKITVVASTVKITKDGEKKIISDGTWTIGFFDEGKKFWTAAEVATANNDPEIGKMAEKVYRKICYPIHMAAQYATIHGIEASEKVTKNLVAMEAEWHSLEDERKAKAKYRKEHADETALAGMEKSAARAAKIAKSDAVKAFAKGVVTKADRYMEAMEATETTDVDSALAALEAFKAAKKAA